MPKQIGLNSQTIVVAKNPKRAMNIEDNIYIISNKLKVLILFAISQQQIIGNKREKVYLMNPEYLKVFGYKDIKNLVDNKSNQIKGAWNGTYDFNSLSKIIPIFENKKLKKCEEKLNSQNINPWVVKYEPFQLVDKYIYLNKNFVIVNDKLFELFNIYFGITPTNDANNEIYYILKMGEGDLLILKNLFIFTGQSQINVQNIILFGVINNKENK